MSTHLLELDEVFRRYAWSLLKKRTNFIRRAFLDENDYNCEVDWSSLSIEHKLSKFVPNVKDGTIIETNWGNEVTGTRWVPLWTCDFDNKADMKQAHTFRGSRDTTTWVDVDLTQGYSVNKEISVEVNIPPNFSRFRAGRDNCLSLNKVRGQVFKEMLTWEVNSQVEVLPSWRAHAQLLAKEECSSMEFEIRTTIMNTKDIVPVSFKRKSDNRVSFIVDLENFQEAFKTEEEGGVLLPEEKSLVEVFVQKTVNAEGEEKTTTFPQIITKGTCICLSWSDQKVDIKTSPLSVDESTFDGGVNASKNLSQKKFVVKAH